MFWEDDPEEIRRKQAEIKAAVEARTKQFQPAYCSDELIFANGSGHMFAQMRKLKLRPQAGSQ